MSRRDTPEVRQLRGTPEPKPGRCGGKLALTDPPRYCTQWNRKGRKGCKLHGGNARVGPDHASFTHGKSSKYAILSPRLLAQFEQSLADVKLMDLKPDVALLDLLTWEAAASLGDGASAAQWQAARKAYDALDVARTKESVQAAMAALGAILRTGADAAGAREEVSKLAERRAKVVQKFQQLQVDTGDLIPAKHVGVALAIFAALMREFIDDDARRIEFSRRFTATLGARLRSATHADVVDAEPRRIVGTDGTS